MLTSKSPDPRNGKKQVAHWDYESVPNGTSLNGWIAGEPFGAWVHYERDRSFVCAKEMSDGALQCERCAGGLLPDWRGYVPWYDRDYTNRFSLITFPYLESVREIELHAPIELSRAKAKKQPCVIRFKAWRTTPLPPAEARRASVNLHDFLVFVLWKNDALARYARGQVPVPQLEGMETDKRVAFPFEKLANALDHQAEESDRTSTLAKRNAAFVREVQTKHTKTNGKPPK